MNLKEKIAALKNIAVKVKASDGEVVMVAAKTTMREIEMFEIITKLQEIIRIQAEGLETLKAPKELTEGLVGGWPCICCGQDVRKIDIYVREILDKTKELTEG